MSLDNRTTFYIQALAKWGFHAKTITKKVKDWNGERISTGQVYRCCKEEGVKLRAYRDGTTSESRKAFGLAGQMRSQRLRAAKRRP